MSYQEPIIDSLLERYHKQLGEDRGKYRNHVYRVYLNCLLLDKNERNHEKYAYAAVFHDIGIWTARTIDYLQPSITEACEWLANNGKSDLVGEITLMIYWHHKVSSYQGPFQQTVTVFRKADWIDVSLGLLRFGIPLQSLKKNLRAFPTLGFHAFLIKKVVRNFFKHPLKPLPMFKK